MRQIVESDRKIRAVSLLKFSGFTLSEIDDAVQSSSQSSSQSDEDRTADTIMELMTVHSWPAASDANIIYYVSCAIERSTVQTTKCNNCQVMLVHNDKHMEALNSQKQWITMPFIFRQLINRGGLYHP